MPEAPQKCMAIFDDISLIKTISGKYLKEKFRKEKNLQMTFNPYYMLLVANLANTSYAKRNADKMMETLAYGTHLRVLSESYPMNTNMTGFR